MRFISCDITPPVIYSLGGRYTHISTHTGDPHKINYRKPGMFGLHVPSLKVNTEDVFQISVK